jgi:hypothetical protein
MIRRTLAGALMLTFALGVLAVVAPTPALADPNCVLCPAIVIDCGPCGVLHPQTCKRCQYCTPIPNCTA